MLVRVAEEVEPLMRRHKLAVPILREMKPAAPKPDVCIELTAHPATAFFCVAGTPAGSLSEGW